MDIKQLQYFIAVVDCSCNLSEASKKIHISQPALSQMIKTFEEREDVILFERSHGRLEKLSPTGELFYTRAQEVVITYNEMMEQLRMDATQLKGKIKIGIPPLILATVFSSVASELIINNPDIKIEIVEIGAYELKKSLILQEVDLAILLQPTELNSDNIKEVILIENELCAFMDKNNPLTSYDKLNWAQLHRHPMAIFNNSFMIHHQLIQTFEQQKVKPNILITSASWDFLLQSTIGTELVTILPSPILDYFQNNHTLKKEFQHPVSWKVVVCRHKKRVYSKIEEYIFNSIINYFK